MKKDILAAGLLVAMLVFLAAGCLNRTSDTTATDAAADTTKSAPAAQVKKAASTLTMVSQAVVDFVSPLKRTGVALMLMGGLAFFLKGPAAGICLTFMGGATAYIGASILQHPWVTLIIPVILLAVAGLAVWLVYKDKATHDRAAVIIDAVNQAEHKSEITGAIKEQGEAVAKFVDGLVAPIEKALAKTDGGGGGFLGALLGKIMKW